MRVRFRFRSIYARMLTSLLVLTILPLFGVGFFVYLRSAAILENKITESSIQSLSQAQVRLDGFVADAANVADTIANHPDFQHMLGMSASGESAITYNGTQEFVRFSKLMTLTHPDIVRITLVGRRLQRVDSLGRYLAVGGNDDTERFRRILAMSGPGVLPPNPQEKMLSYAQSVYDAETGVKEGAVIVDLDLNQIQDYLNGVHPLRNGYLFLVDAEGRYVFRPGAAAGAAFRAPWPETAADKPTFFTDRLEGRRTLIIQGSAANGGWQLYGVVPYSDITRQMADNRDAILLSGFILAVAVAAVAFFLRAQLVAPIRRLQASMSRVERGDLQHSFVYRSHDEIGLLGRSFNRMVGRIDELIRDNLTAKSRESEAKLLQQEAQYEALEARVTPHFLYNTLDAVGWLARDRGVREITAVVDALAGMLRYSLERSSPLVTLRQEFEHAALYADIIDFRVGGRVRFRFELPEELGDVSVPRFTLQPLVENAVQHGVEPLGEEAVVAVRAYAEAAVVVVEVADTGVGIGPDDLDRLIARLAGGPGAAPATSEGIGLPNVHQRLRMNFGDGCGLTLARGERGGFVVRALVPLRPAERLRPVRTASKS